MLDEFRSTNITWDKATSRIYSPVTANESDENGRKLVVQIVNGGQVEDLTGATLHLYWETRDKLHDGLDVFKAVDLKKGEFELSYTTGMLSNKGVLNANLVLIDTVGRVVSERFKITVTEGIDDDAIQSENSFSSLTQALVDISNLEQNYAPRLNDLTAQLQQNVVTTDLHITMHFNYTDPIEIQEHIDNLKKLGYNTVIIQRTSNPMLNDVTGVETKKLIKQFKDNNMNMILHVDYETLVSSNYQPVANWIYAIDDTNIVGYWYADEPFDTQKPKDDLMLAYNRLKIITSKPIFVTDPCYNSNFYVKCFDVLLWNIYLNSLAFKDLNPSQQKFKLLYNFVDHFYNQLDPPKTVIPMYPTFSKYLEDGSIDFSLPTMAETQTMVDFYKNTGIASNNISTFMYHYRDTAPFDDLYNNGYLKYLSHYILQNGKTPNQQDIHYLNRSNYATSSALVSTDMIPSATYDSLVLSNETAGEIILRVTKKGGYVNNELFFRCEVHNNGDAVEKNIEVAISYDGSTYVQSAFKNFTAGNNAFPFPTDPVVSLNVQNTERSFFVRFRLKNTDDTPMDSGVYPHVGIKKLYVGLI